MEATLIKRLEHIALKSNLDLRAFGEKFQTALTIPAMEYDCENETEWLESESDGINYNVSKPYDAETLHDWDDTTPAGCNFGISIGIMKRNVFADDENWIFENLVAKICRQLADTFSTEVYYHRTFIVEGLKNIQRNIEFKPKIKNI